MPTYEYECQVCKYQFEIIQPITDDSLTVCPECLKPDLMKLIPRNVTVIMKGASAHVNVPGAHAEQWKKDKHTREMEALAAEPMTEAEQQAAHEQGLERDKEMGFEAGHSGGGRAPIVSAAERPHLTQAQIDAKMSAARAKGQKRIKVSQDARKGSL